MEKETKTAEDDFLAGLDKEVDLDQQLEDDLFPEEVTPTEEVTTPEEKPPKVSYSKDEKVQKYLDRQISKAKKEWERENKPTETETFKKEVSASNPNLVKAMEAIIGNDTPDKIEALKLLEEAVSNKSMSKQEIQEMLREAQREEAERESRELEEAKDELEEGFESIEDHYGIELNDRQKEAYKDFLLKIEPRGGYQEYPDFVETFEVFKNYVKANRPSNSQAKTLASRGMQQSSTTVPTTETFIKTDGKETLWQKFSKMKDNI